MNNHPIIGIESKHMEDDRISTRNSHQGATDRNPVTTTQRDAKQRVTLDLVLHELRAHHFAVLSSVDESGAPDSAGVNYGVSAPGHDLTLYVMTRRHLKKARNIARNPHVALVIPLPRRLLQFLPPATIQLRGRAEILDWTDEQGTEAFRRFWMGRRILAAYEKSRKLGETRVCFLKITLEPVIHTYAVGYSIWDIWRHMESAGATIRIPAEPRGKSDAKTSSLS